MLSTSTNEAANDALVQTTREYISLARSVRTKKAYQYQWDVFAAWCSDQGRLALPASADTVAMYLASKASYGLKVATLAQGLAAISEVHRAAGHESPRSLPAVRETFKGIRNRHGAPPQQKAPVLVEDLQKMVRSLPDTIQGARDRALLLVGWSGAFRRSELVALDVSDVQWTNEGVRLLLRRSKTDQQGAGRWVAIPAAKEPAMCPVRALQAWLEKANCTSGPLFRGVNRHGQLRERLDSKEVARVVKKHAEAAGLDPEQFSGHSLRAGLITSAAKAGVPTHKIQAQSGHKSVNTLNKYIRDANAFQDNAAGLL